MDGTYRLPEAQLDRFLMRISVGYPEAESERDILTNEDGGRSVRDLKPVVTADQVQGMIELASRVHVSDAMKDYLVALSAATRALPEVRLGASPRGTLAMLRACRAMAAASGREYSIPEDAKALAVPVLAHRMILKPDAELRGATAPEMVRRVLDAVPVPQIRPA
jgi:MoxR-like ATPase